MKTEDIRKFEQEERSRKNQKALIRQLVAVELTDDMSPSLAPADQQVLTEIIEMVKKHSFVAQAMPKNMVRVEKFLFMALLEQQRELQRLRAQIELLP